jgi:hypothetical protein
MQVQVIEKPDYTILSIKHDAISADILSSFEFPDIQGGGLVIDGAKPSWLIAFLACKYKNVCSWIAVSVPATKEAVVFCGRSPQFPVGDSFPFDLALNVGG